jgi:Secretion system C-terminal sorting domain/SdrD B-like domain/SprB repeat
MKQFLFTVCCIFLAAFAQAQQINVTLTHQPCDNDGIISVDFSALGFTAPYTITYYFWGSTNTSVVHSNLTNTTDLLTNYNGNNVYIYIRDAANHYANTQFSAMPFNVTYSSTAGICPVQGTGTLTVTSGGVAPFSYAWTAVNSNQVLANTATASLPSGGYNAVVTDAAGCKVYFTDSIYIWSSSNVDANITTVGQTCTNGTATISNPIGGTAPYTYAWSNGTTGAVANNLHANTGYAVTITDAIGCSNIRYAYFNSNTYIQVQGQTTNASCTNGSVSITSINGGNAPYTYEWSNGASSSSINNLIQNAYYVTVTDSDGCTGAGGFYVTQTPLINVQTTVTPATCLQGDGSAIAFGTGGQQPYTYRWADGSTSQTLNNVVSGSYYITATDANGCIGEASVYITSSTPIVAQVTTTPSLCNAATGGAAISISGGSAPYSTVWGTLPARTGTSITNQHIGTYSFNIVDAVGCVQSGAAFVPSVHNISVAAQATAANCIANDGGINTTVTGGTAPYTYRWSNNATSADLTNIAAGYYDVLVTDAETCTKYTSMYVQSLSPVSLGLTTTQASCIYTNDATLTAQATGGTAPYTYSNGTGVQTGLGRGNYSVSVTDANGCTAANYAQTGYDVSNTSCFCTIRGTVFKDANNNCTQDNNEPGIPNMGVSAGNAGYAYTNSDGEYSFQVQSGNYTLSEIVETLYPLAACQQNNIVVTIPATSSGCTTIVNFANNLLPIHDMKINTWTRTPPRPGFVYEQEIIVSNQGTINESSVFMGYRQDAQVPAAAFQTNVFNMVNTNYYNNNASSPTTFAPAQVENYIVNYNVPTTVPLGTILTFKDTVAYDAPVANWLTDYTPWNNVNAHQAFVVGAYDPNFKEVSPRGVGTNHNITRADTVMDYAVHFQNLGTYYAQDVVIIDTLDADLDIKTFKPIYGSHPYTVKISKTGIVTFTFKNIILPTKQQSEEQSKGLVTYSIHVKRNRPNNTKLTNRAAIYFDFNAPVITNQVFNTIKDAVVATEDAEKIANTANFTIFPNPTQGDISVMIDGSAETTAQMLSIVDIQGRVLQTQPFTPQTSAQTLQITTSDLPAGMYFVRLSANNGAAPQVKRFVKVVE